MIDIDGMIGWLMQLMQDTHLTTCLGSSRKDGIAEMILGNHLRTTESKEDATRLDNLEGLVVQTGIALQRIMQRPTVLGKGRRIEDYQVVLVVGALQILESILTEGLMTSVTREIQLYITIRELDGLGTAVDGMNECCPTPHGIERETTRIAEHIEHFLVLGIFLEQGTVLALIDEEARLLATKPVDMEHQPILDGGVIAVATDEEAVFHLIHKWQGGLALVIDIRNAPLHHLLQLLGNAHTGEMHANAMGLHDCRLSIDIDHQSGQVVALAMNQSVGGIVGIVGQTNGDAHVQCRRETGIPEGIVDLDIAERQHTHGNGALLIMADSDETAISAQDTHQIAVVQTIV